MLRHGIKRGRVTADAFFLRHTDAREVWQSHCTIRAEPLYGDAAITLQPR